MCLIDEGGGIVKAASMDRFGHVQYWGMRLML